ncbi:MAG: hypothetical protein ACOX5R_09585 [bacterium]
MEHSGMPTYLSREEAGLSGLRLSGVESPGVPGLERMDVVHRMGLQQECA